MLSLAVFATACAHDETTRSTRPGRSTTSVSRAPSTTTTSSTTTTVAPTTTGSTTTTVPVAPLRWDPCDNGFECTTVTVPVDYAKPDGASIKLAMVRRRARNPDQRIGTLFLNPGGPGGSAIEAVESIPLPDPIAQRFDVIGFDPRGVGRSMALDCRSHLQQMYDDDPTIDDDADRDALLRDSEAFVDECATKYGDLLPHLGTRNVARDMDQIRIAVGDQQINYLGYSYGTALGQTYAALYPRQVRTMVLDGVVDLSQSGLQAAAGQAAGFSSALHAFVNFCDAPATADTCGFGAPAGQVVDEVMARAEQRPIPARRAGRPASPGVVALALTQALYSDSLWPQLARALTDGSRGNGDRLVRLADDYLHRNADGTYPNGFEIYFASTCLDEAFPRDPNRLMDAAKLIGAKYPHIGEALVNDYVRCSLWPVLPKPLRPVPAATKGLPPIVVISTTGDPATPYANGVRVAQQIPGAVLVTNVGEGHTIVAQGKRCIDDAVSTYFITVKPPANGLVCQ